MAKIALFPVLLLAACLIAGVYGALHNQISYTVAPEYFHSFKFIQFDIPRNLHNRFGAALVGWLASWWMGLIISVPVLFVGLILPGWKTYANRCFVAFAIVALTALLVGLAALGLAGLQGRTPYDCALAMHNASYLGGLVGIFTGSAYLVVARFRLGMRRPTP
jgi:hypothetical protein